MKYTDRKKTPLKWHRTVSFVLMPLMIIGLAYLLACMANELFGLHAEWLPVVFTPVLQMVNPSLSIRNLGSMFWPVTGAFFVTILLLILAIWIWIGFLRWKNYARNLWLIYLLARTACLLTAAVLVITRSDILQALRMFAAFDSMSRTFLHFFYAILIVISLWNLIFLILNFMYYQKRKPLFQKNYIQPSADMKKTDAAENEKPESAVSVKAEENTQEQEESKEPVEEKPAADSSDGLSLDAQNISAETDAAQKDQNELQKDTEETDASDEPEKNPDHVFCPYCGAKLGPYDVNYCSHCGHQLS